MWICTGCDYYVSYPLDVFVMDVGELMVFVFPAALCVVLWKIFVSNRIKPRGNILSLGLDATSATHTELYGRKIPWGPLLMYASFGALAFKLGVLAFSAHCYFDELRSALHLLVELGGCGC